MRSKENAYRSLPRDERQRVPGTRSWMKSRKCAQSVLSGVQDAHKKSKALSEAALHTMRLDGCGPSGSPLWASLQPRPAYVWRTGVFCVGAGRVPLTRPEFEARVHAEANHAHASAVRRENELWRAAPAFADKLRTRELLWFRRVVTKTRAAYETMHLARYCFDRTRSGSGALQQLCALGAVSVAGKFLDDDCLFPLPEQLCRMKNSGFCARQVVAAEVSLLRILDFQLHVPSEYELLRLLHVPVCWLVFGERVPAARDFVFASLRWSDAAYFDAATSDCPPSLTAYCCVLLGLCSVLARSPDKPPTQLGPLFRDACFCAPVPPRSRFAGARETVRHDPVHNLGQRTDQQCNETHSPKRGKKHGQKAPQDTHRARGCDSSRCCERVARLRLGHFCQACAQGNIEGPGTHQKREGCPFCAEPLDQARGQPHGTLGNASHEMRCTKAFGRRCGEALSRDRNDRLPPNKQYRKKLCGERGGECCTEPFGERGKKHYEERGEAHYEKEHYAKCCEERREKHCEKYCEEYCKKLHAKRCDECRGECHDECRDECRGGCRDECHDECCDECRDECCGECHDECCEERCNECCEKRCEECCGGLCGERRQRGRLQCGRAKNSAVVGAGGGRADGLGSAHRAALWAAVCLLRRAAPWPAGSPCVALRAELLLVAAETGPTPHSSWNVGFCPQGHSRSDWVHSVMLVHARLREALESVSLAAEQWEAF